MLATSCTHISSRLLYVSNYAACWGHRGWTLLHSAAHAHHYGSAWFIIYLFSTLLPPVLLQLMCSWFQLQVLQVNCMYMYIYGHMWVVPGSAEKSIHVFTAISPDTTVHTPMLIGHTTVVQVCDSSWHSRLCTILVKKHWCPLYVCMYSTCIVNSGWARSWYYWLPIYVHVWSNSQMVTGADNISINGSWPMCKVYMYMYVCTVGWRGCWGGCVFTLQLWMLRQLVHITVGCAYVQSRMLSC